MYIVYYIKNKLEKNVCDKKGWLKCVKISSKVYVNVFKIPLSKNDWKVLHLQNYCSDDNNFGRDESHQPRKPIFAYGVLDWVHYKLITIDQPVPLN